MEWFRDLSTEEKWSALKNVVAMMVADGKIDDAEKMWLTRVCGRLGLDVGDVQRIFNDPTSISFTTPQNPTEKAYQLIDSVFMMVVDGHIDSREMDLCLKLAGALGFNPGVVPKVVAAIVEAVQQGQNRDQIGEMTNSLLSGGLG